MSPLIPYIDSTFTPVVRSSAVSGVSHAKPRFCKITIENLKSNSGSDEGDAGQKQDDENNIDLYSPLLSGRQGDGSNEEEGGRTTVYGLKRFTSEVAKYPSSSKTLTLSTLVLSKN